LVYFGLALPYLILFRGVCRKCCLILPSRVVVTLLSLVVSGFSLAHYIGPSCFCIVHFGKLSRFPRVLLSSFRLSLV
jgi:hypothetical protein